jgi:hypothetical protein
MALDLIRTRLQGLKTTIKLNQFFPRAYFSERFEAEKVSDAENTETWVTLRNFSKKYTLTTDESWAYHTAFEVVTFQAYDAPDFRQYLAVRLNGHGRAEVVSESSRASSELVSSETTPNTLESSVKSSKRESAETEPEATAETPAKTPVEKPVEGPNPVCQKSVNVKPCHTPSCTAIGTTTGDRNSVKSGNSKSSTSSKLKAKFKKMFSFSSKKKSGGKQKPSKTATNGKMSGRTEALLTKHSHVVRRGKK